MKKVILFIVSLLLFTAALILTAFADGKGNMYNVYNGTTVIVNNSWEYVDAEKTLYIRSKDMVSYNETGSIAHDESNSWKPYIKYIEHIVLEGYFKKCSTNAFKNHTALKDVRITANVNEIDGGAFEGCNNLESITVGDGEHVKGRADLKNITVIRSKGSFKNTKLNEILLSENVRIEGSDIFNEGANVCIPKGTPGYDSLLSVGIYNVIDASPVNIDITIDGSKHSFVYDYGSDIRIPTVDGNCVLLYTDKACTLPYGEKYAYKSISLYGKKLLELSDISMRTEKYHGIRMLYRADTAALDRSHDYEIKEIGALALLQNGFGNELTCETSDAHKIVAYMGGRHFSALLDVPENGITEFAHTAVGFEKDGKLIKDRAEQNIYFRAYVKLYSKEDGRAITRYTDTVMLNLADAADQIKKADLTADQLEFVNQPVSLGAFSNYIYTKDELLKILKDVSNDESRYIQGQHLDSNMNELSNFIGAANAAAGKTPALVAFDISQMLSLDARTMNIIEECKEFINRGGIVSFSYHMENPTGNYTSEGTCRGELGGEEKWKELITEGTALNTRFNEILDIAADVLNEFDKDGYPVIWRPLHENNGDWFWWCAIQTFEENGKEITRPIDQQTVIDLWIYVYNYYTSVKGLKNLVWAYSPNVTNASSPVPTLYCYPGDDYCDIAGTDWYTAGSYEVDGSGRSYMSLVESTGKMAALTEFGPGGSLAVFSCKDQLDIMKRMIGDGMSPVYVLNWSGKCSLLKLGEIDTLMNDECVLDLDEIKEMFNKEYKNR